MADQPELPEALSLRAMTRLAHVDALRDAAEYLISQVPTATDQHAHPGEHITQARRARLLALQLLDRAVLLDLASGASWDTIAERLNWPLDTVLARYQQMWTDWQANPRPGSTPGELDQWYAKVCPGAPPNAVSAGLH